MFFELLSFAIVSTTAPTSCAESLSSFQRLYIQSALSDRQERIYGNVRSAKWALPNLPSRSRLAALHLKIFEPLSASEQSLVLVEKVFGGRRGKIVRGVEEVWKKNELPEIFEGGSVLQFSDMRLILSENGRIAYVEIKKRKSWIRLPQTVIASVEEDYIMAMRLRQKNDAGGPESFSHIMMRASDDKRLSQAREYNSIHFETSGIPVLIIRSSSPFLWEVPTNLNFYRARMKFNGDEERIEFHLDTKNSPFEPFRGYRPVDYKRLNNSLVGSPF